MGGVAASLSNIINSYQSPPHRKDTISHELIVSNDSSGLSSLRQHPIFSVYDLMTIACGYMDTGATARKEFRRLIKDGSKYQQEIVASC